MSKRVLFIDDDPNVLHSVKRTFRKRYEIDTAPCASEGVAAVKEKGPFAVVISDMQMSVTNGVECLKQIQELSRDTVRIMLTGNADQRTAVEAVNEGHIFRFLNKPCSEEQLGKAIDAGLEQYRLVTAERDLLSKTLSGSLSILSEVLSVVSPKAFGQSGDIRLLARALCARLDVANAWEIEVAASLSSLGFIAVPDATLERVAAGHPLSTEEQRLFDIHPAIGSKLVAKIPRLEQVAEYIAKQSDPLSGDRPPLGARVLRIARDFLQFRTRVQSDEEAIELIHANRAQYDNRLIHELKVIVSWNYTVSSVTLEDLCEDMILDENLCSDAGEILIAAGRRIAPVFLERLRNFARHRRIREPIRVRIPMAEWSDSNTPNETKLAVS
ncbi:Hydrogenase transcriptional regulatory protein hupR1 [Planctomycetes bacterium Pan216]|uniref:Hydrogenase transcriptional regulatory protein hupR1 n=1 Tax=Kolteria novifilia TaxID=2527975 RepID=A0A518AYX3_9BACT|nr:Hydrogenase transcriptional regulatory protein hupR1 [Planctomycetes bacterium Pan216]